jgi:hypothetical protein
MDVLQKIAADAYRPALEYPTKRPGTRGSEAFKAKMDEWRAEEARLEEQFYRDLCATFGVDADDPFARKMYALAYESGHSAGYSEVAGDFGDLVPLWELYVAKGVEPTTRAIKR